MLNLSKWRTAQAGEIAEDSGEIEAILGVPMSGELH
jgi:hypothetical protein